MKDGDKGNVVKKKKDRCEIYHESRNKRTKN